MGKWRNRQPRKFQKLVLRGKGSSPFFPTKTLQFIKGFIMKSLVIFFLLVFSSLSLFSESIPVIKLSDLDSQYAKQIVVAQKRMIQIF